MRHSWLTKFGVLCLNQLVHTRRLYRYVCGHSASLHSLTLLLKSFFLFVRGLVRTRIAWRIISFSFLDRVTGQTPSQYTRQGGREAGRPPLSLHAVNVPDRDYFPKWRENSVVASLEHILFWNVLEVCALDNTYQVPGAHYDAVGRTLPYDNSIVLPTTLYSYPSQLPGLRPPHEIPWRNPMNHEIFRQFGGN